MYNITRTAKDLKQVEALIKDKTFNEARELLNCELESDIQGRYFVVNRENYQVIIVEEESGSYSMEEVVLIRDEDGNNKETTFMSYKNIIRFIKE